VNTGIRTDIRPRSVEALCGGDKSVRGKGKGAKLESRFERRRRRGTKGKVGLLEKRTTRKTYCGKTVGVFERSTEPRCNLLRRGVGVMEREKGNLLHMWRRKMQMLSHRWIDDGGVLNKRTKGN